MWAATSKARSTSAWDSPGRYNGSVTKTCSVEPSRRKGPSSPGPSAPVSGRSDSGECAARIAAGADSGSRPTLEPYGCPPPARCQECPIVIREARPWCRAPELRLSPPRDTIRTTKFTERNSSSVTMNHGQAAVLWTTPGSLAGGRRSTPDGAVFGTLSRITPHTAQL